MKGIQTILLTLISVFALQTLVFAQDEDPYKDYLETESGLKFIITQRVNGPEAKAGDRVAVHYTGKLLDGTIFDSSYDRDKPFIFELGAGRVIKGWDEGIAYLHQGDKATFVIPPELAYGSREMGKIPANSILVFDVELVKVMQGETIKEFDVAGKDTVKLKSGLQYIISKEGSGEGIKKNQTAEVSYSAFLTDGKLFDSTVKRGKNHKFPVGTNSILPGIDQGVMGMKKGEKRRLIIPPDLGFGSRDVQNIPANSILVFDVELVNIEEAPKVEPYKVDGLEESRTQSGLTYIVVSEGTGKMPENGKNVKVHYTGYLQSGEIFDSSVRRGKPIEFPLGTGRVIKGWDEGIALMNVGSKYRLIIPPELGYGSRAQGSIPANSTLIFDVELVSAD